MLSVYFTRILNLEIIIIRAVHAPSNGAIWDKSSELHQHQMPKTPISQYWKNE